MENDEYNKELKKLKEEFEREADKACQESDRLYNEMAEKLGHKQFLSQGINKPITECSKKYSQKFKELEEKYKINHNRK